MLFVTREFFLGFLPIVLAAFHISLALGFRKLLLPILLVGSVVFYAWGNPSETPILIVSILVNYLTGRGLVDLGLSPSRRKALFILALTFNLGMLAFFKYTNFALDNLAAVFDLAPRHINIALPIGISFYTFTQIAFLTDIYKNGERQRDIASYGLFVTYFPHLVAGPIIHWRDVMPQFRILGRKEGLSFASSAYATFLIEGICLFSIGLIKKLLIADQLSVFVNLGYKAVPSLGFTDAWLLSLAYTFQLYFDFSGYADMAVGISLLFGIRIPYNFNSPYIAVSIQDFWRRWHMTLSRWLRDYLYIPLGGNRGSSAMIYRNLFLTFLLGGLWHGAAWTFIIWGALHGLGCCVHRLWSTAGYRMPKLVGIVVTFLFINMTWVYFRAPDLATANTLLLTMAKPQFDAPALLFAVRPLLVISALLVWFCPNSQAIASADWRGRIALSGAFAGVAAIVAMVATNTSISSPFIYYNF
ncbi:MBOAT family O-acyltransferase [Bradyrhizobium prioriisuperbiae]|uniref:MBOAT family O-acyltransferase n=1 Tax=Bradyrhizobium prioriisuperbiae TaxID=2854389 RepID=UPI0028EEB902|nr:MBOAT family O-acyltransferase [Bradyrhizobium prioritasuperba]